MARDTLYSMAVVGLRLESSQSALEHMPRVATLVLGGFPMALDVPKTLRSSMQMELAGQDY